MDQQRMAYGFLTSGRQKIKMRAIGFALLLLFIAPAAWADNNAADIRFGCAPWDGRTLEIKVGAPDVTYKITVWGQGLDALWKGGRKVDINNTDGPTTAGSGRAEVCGHNDKCQPENLGIEFEKLDLQHGGAVKGTIKGTIPFEGTLSQSNMFCG